jgi:hypothetical protein
LPLLLLLRRLWRLLGAADTSRLLLLLLLLLFLLWRFLRLLGRGEHVLQCLLLLGTHAPPLGRQLCCFVGEQVPEFLAHSLVGLLQLVQLCPRLLQELLGLQHMKHVWQWW